MSLAKLLELTGLISAHWGSKRLTDGAQRAYWVKDLTEAHQCSVGIIRAHWRVQKVSLDLKKLIGAQKFSPKFISAHWGLKRVH